MVDESIIRSKLTDLSINIKRISVLQKDNPEEDFINDWRIFTSCERLFEVIIQSIIDICTHIVSFYPSKPENSSECIQYLIQEKIIRDTLGGKIISSIKMRNLLVHQYANVNYSILYNSIENIVKDGGEFKSQIIQWLKNRDNE